jgi:hypothetical protein
MAPLSDTAPFFGSDSTVGCFVRGLVDCGFGRIWQRGRFAEYSKFVMVPDAESIRGHFLGIARRRRLGVCRNDFPTNICTGSSMEKTSVSLGQGGITNVNIESCVCAAV